MTIATQATVGVTTFNQESKGNQTRIKLESTITLVSKNTSSHPVRSGWMDGGSNNVKVLSLFLIQSC